jgi:hypothetical protein
MEKEKKKWQDRNADNIKGLLRKNDAQQSWGGIRMMTRVWKQSGSIKDKGVFQGTV